MNRIGREVVVAALGLVLGTAVLWMFGKLGAVLGWIGGLIGTLALGAWGGITTKVEVPILVLLGVFALGVARPWRLLKKKMPPRPDPPRVPEGRREEAAFRALCKADGRPLGPDEFGQYGVRFSNLELDQALDALIAKGLVVFEHGGLLGPRWALTEAGRDFHLAQKQIAEDHLDGF